MCLISDEQFLIFFLSSEDIGDLGLLGILLTAKPQWNSRIQNKIYNLLLRERFLGKIFC